MTDSELSAIAHYELVMGMEKEMPELKGIGKYVMGRMHFTKAGAAALKRYVSMRRKIASDLATMMEDNGYGAAAKTVATPALGGEPAPEDGKSVCRASVEVCRAHPAEVATR